MPEDFDATARQPLIRLLDIAFSEYDAEVIRRLATTDYSDIRPAHGCVFGNVDPDGTRLTDLADRAHMTKQSVGEVVTDLQQLGYVERIPDPSDGRAKIIRLTARGARRPGARLETDQRHRARVDRALRGRPNCRTP